MNELDHAIAERLCRSVETLMQGVNEGPVVVYAIGDDSRTEEENQKRLEKVLGHIERDIALWRNRASSVHG